MMAIDWCESMEQWADRLRGRRLSVAFSDVLEQILQEHKQWLASEDTPSEIEAALRQLIASGRWRTQPKGPQGWIKGWRGLMIPNKLIYQPQDREQDVVHWHPWLAEKGAATRAKGKYRDKLKRLNQHLIRCEILNEDPFPGDILGQRERALRLFEDEKALDSMPDNGWKSVPLDREDLRCVKKPPPIKKVDQPQGVKPPLILENVETFHRFVDINNAHPTWVSVIWGSGAQVSGQSEEIAKLVIDSGFDRIMYFGDLDAKGLEIVDTLRRNLKNQHINVVLEENLYRLIIESDLTTNGGSANYAGIFETSWMPSLIVSNLQRLVAINRRIPQEAFVKDILGE